MKGRYSKVQVRVVLHLPCRLLFYLFALFWCRAVFRVRLQSQGPWPRGVPVILAAKHHSHIDTLAIMAALGLRGFNLRPIAARDYWFQPCALSLKWLARWLMRWSADSLPISRQTGEQWKQDLRHIAEVVVRDHQLVLIYPTGGRNQTTLKRGLGYLVTHCLRTAEQMCVLPIVLSGTKRVLPAGQSLPKWRDVWKRRQINVSVGEPLVFRPGHTSGTTDHALECLVTTQVGRALDQLDLDLDT